MKLSIVIPHYNRTEKLLACLDSIAANDYLQRNYEVIVIDDCSTQNIDAITSYKKIKNYKFERLHNNSGGASAPRNHGISIARGKYLTFIDSDDTISSGFLKTGMKLAEEGDCDLVLTKRSGRFESRSLRYYTEDACDINMETDLKEASIILWDNMVHSKFYKASILKNYKIKFDTAIRLCEDVIFSVQIFPLIKSAGLCVSETYNFMPTDELSLNSQSKFGPKEVAQVIEYAVRNVFSIPDEFPLPPLSTADKKAMVVHVIFKSPFSTKILKSHEILYQLKKSIGDHLSTVKDSQFIHGVSRYKLAAILNSQPNGIVKFDYLEWHLGKPLESGRKIMYRVKGDQQWIQAPSAATAVANGWILGTTPYFGGCEIYRWNGWDWDRVPGGATQIYGTYEQPWVVNETGHRYVWENGAWKNIASFA